MGIDISTRRVKGTPHRIVLTKSKMIGIFNSGRYIQKKNMLPEHFAIIKKKAKNE